MQPRKQTFPRIETALPAGANMSLNTVKVDVEPVDVRIEELSRSLPRPMTW